MKTSVADVYIIESLDPDDEGNGRFEGIFLSHVLRLHGKNPLYKYVRTRAEFEKAIRAGTGTCICLATATRGAYARRIRKRLTSMSLRKYPIWLEGDSLYRPAKWFTQTMQGPLSLQAGATP